MNKIKNIKLIVLVAIIGLFASCKSDDSIDDKSNEIEVNSRNFDIAEVVMFDDGTYDGVTEFELYFTGSGVSIDDDEDLSGSGDLLSLRLFSSQETGLSAGDYLYNDQDDTSFLLNRGYHFFGYDSSQGDDESGNLDIESGRISVSVENNIYTITINLKDEDGEMVSGYYKGAIRVVEKQKIKIKEVIKDL